MPTTLSVCSRPTGSTSRFAKTANSPGANDSSHRFAWPCSPSALVSLSTFSDPSRAIVPVTRRFGSSEARTPSGSQSNQASNVAEMTSGAVVKVCCSPSAKLPAAGIQPSRPTSHRASVAHFEGVTESDSENPVAFGPKSIVSTSGASASSCVESDAERHPQSPETTSGPISTMSKVFVPSPHGASAIAVASLCASIPSTRASSQSCRTIVATPGGSIRRTGQSQPFILKRCGVWAVETQQMRAGIPTSTLTSSSNTASAVRTTGAGGSQTDGETVTSKVHVARHAPSMRGISTLSPVPELLATPLAFDDTTSHETCAGRPAVSSESVFGSMQSSPPEYSSRRTTLSLPPTTPESLNVKFVQSAVAATEPADGPSTSHVSTSVPSHSGGSTFGLLAAIAARTKSAARATSDNVRVVLISEPPMPLSPC